MSGLSESERAAFDFIGNDHERALVLRAVERIRDDAVAEMERRGHREWCRNETCLRMGYSTDQHDRAVAEAAERALVERVRAACDELERPFAGARQRANTNEDFAEIAAEEKARKNAAARVRAALQPEAATTERRWDECLHGVTLGSVCLDCPSKWASIPARPAATTEGAADETVLTGCTHIGVAVGDYCRGCGTHRRAAAAVHPDTEGAVEQEGAHFACCDLPDGGCGGCGNCPEHCVCDRPCGYCIAARAARGEGEPT